MNEENIEYYRVVWLDSSLIDNKNTKNLEEKLRSSINSIKIFLDENQFLNSIESITKNDKIILIINSKLAKDILSRIHQIEQIKFIYFFALNIKKHQELTKLFYKVKFYNSKYT